MKPFLLKRLSVMIGLMFLASLGYAEEEKAEAGPDNSTSGTWRGFVTPKLGYFDNSGNPAYLNRYNLLDSTFGNGSSNGFIADLDFSLLFRDDSGASLFLEKDGYGATNQRLRLRGNTSSARFGAYFSTFKSATGTYDFQYNPDMVAGGTDPRYGDPTLNNVNRSGHVAYFTNDSPGVSDYEIRRNSYGASVVLKPELFADRGSAELGFDGYTRNGNQTARYLLNNNTIDGRLANSEKYLWRGYSNPIDQQDGKLAFNLNWTPQDDLFFNYEFSVDKFTNDVLPVTFGDVAKWSGLPRLFSPGADLLTPLNFVPDSTQYSNGLRMSKNFGGSAAVSMGVNYTQLQQDTYSEVQYVAGYRDGSIDTSSAYLTGKFNVSQSVGLEAFARYNERKNNSSYPVTNFYEPVSQYTNPRMVMPRIDSYKYAVYGVEAKFYPSFLKTTWSAGWKYERKENDLTWGTIPALAPPISLYGDQYSANEVFIKLVSRPVRGLILRATPSYLWADETQLTTDPKQLFKFKSSAIYTKPEWSGMAVTGYYNYSRRNNDSLSYSDYILNPPGFANPQYQDVTNTTQSFGLNLSVVPAEDLKLSAGYDWNQNDLGAYYFSTNRLRFDYPILYPGVPNKNPDQPLDFLILDQFNYKADTQTFSVGLESTQWERYLFSANYSLMLADGYNASGLAGQSLPPVDDKIDTLLHTLSLGMEYNWKKNISVRGVYIYDRYQDNAYEALNGSRNTLWLGINYRL